jgi:DNA-binding transcriptional regulator YdaS (Cro superfamily)
MTALPAEYHFHELKKLLGEYKPKPDMPCWHCDEPEAAEICFAFANFVCAARPRLPRGPTPTLDAIADLAEPLPESPPTLADDVLSGDRIKAAAIKAAGGIRSLARRLGIRPEAIEQWTCIPAERLQAVATISGWPQHVLRPDLFPGVDEPQSYWRTKEEEDEAWLWSHTRQLWLPLPYPPGFLPARCCARRPQLTLVVGGVP